MPPKRCPFDDSDATIVPDVSECSVTTERQKGQVIVRNVLMISISVMALFAYQAPAQDNNAGAVVGEWVEEFGRARFELYESEGKYFGKISWLRDPPSPKAVEKSYVGLVILKDFAYVGNNKYTGGTVHNPEDGHTYRARLTLDNPDRLVLRGYVWVPLLGRSTVWTRYKPEEPRADERQAEEQEPVPIDAPTGSIGRAMRPGVGIPNESAPYLRWRE